MRIIHISDLHIQEKESLSIQRIERLFETLRNYQFDHLVITGDISDSGKREEYEICADFLKRYGYYHYHRCTVISGNHDISGDAALSISNNYEKRLAKKKQFFNSFAALFLNTDSISVDNPQTDLIIVKEMNNICLATIDATSLHHPSFGEVTSEQFKKIESLLKDVNKNKILIGLIHYPPHSRMTGDERIDTYLVHRLNDCDKVFKKLRQFPFSLILHGHAHTASRKLDFVSSCIRIACQGSATGDITQNRFPSFDIWEIDSRAFFERTTVFFSTDTIL